MASRILRSAISGRVPSVNQLESTEDGLGYNRADAILYGLKVNGTAKEVVPLNGPESSSFYTHPGYIVIEQSLTGATVLASLKTDAIGSVTELTTRTLTLADLGYTGADPYWVRDNYNNILSPASNGDYVGIFSSDAYSLLLLGADGISLTSQAVGIIESYLNHDAVSGQQLRVDIAGASYPSGPSVAGTKVISTTGTTWSSTNYGSSWEVQTCLNGSTSLVQRLKIKADGKVSIGNEAAYEYCEIYNRLLNIYSKSDLPEISQYRSDNSTYVKNNMQLGMWRVHGYTGSNFNPGLQILVSAGSDWSNSSMPTIVDIGTIASGVDASTNHSRIKIDSNGWIIINDDAQATNFIIEGENDANLLLVNGESDMVGIGVSNVLTKLHIKGSSSWGQALVKVDQADDNEPFIEFTGTSSADTTKNISTQTGAGAIVGPKYKTDVSDGWEFNCMVRQSVNGSDVWFAGYTPILSS